MSNGAYVFTQALYRDRMTKGAQKQILMKTATHIF